VRIPRRREIAVHWASNCVTAFEGQQSSNQRLAIDLERSAKILLRVLDPRIGEDSQLAALVSPR
jgi:hypothetical protein